jgi:hypothetical protein
VKITQIEIHWTESNLCPDGRIYNSLEEANRLLAQISREERGKGGYCKVKYTATFEDGETYSGRIDVQGPENDFIPCFLAAMQDYVAFLAGKRKPGHMSEEVYRDYIKGNDPVEMAEWLERLEIA